MGTFPACVVCPGGRRVFRWAGRLLKLSQPGRFWNVGKCWERCRRWSGAGGCSQEKITVVSGALYFVEKIGISVTAIFDNLYRKCYNKCNDDNKKAICRQSPKFALYGVFAFRDIKSCWAAENAVQTIYIKYGNTKRPELYVTQGHTKKSYLYIRKRAFC